MALLVAGVGATVLIVALFALGHRPSVELPVALTIHGAAAGGASVVDTSGTLLVKASAVVGAAVLLVVLSALGLLVLVLRQLRALLADVVAGSPFGPRSARRVQLVGAAIIAGELLRALVVLLASLWARAHVHLAGLDFAVSFPIQLSPLGAGLLLILLAEVFRRGAALQQDHDLTI